MENIEKMIDLWHKKRANREEQFAEIKKKQISEYSNLIDTVQTIKDEMSDCKETVSKNLQRLTTHKHSIYNLCIDNSENTQGLPISHNYHRQAIIMFSEVANFINKFQTVYKNFDVSIEHNDEHFVDLMDEITCSTKYVGNELFKIKSLLTEVNTLQRNADILQYYLADTDEDMEI
ncbi:uncharacterized protein LOC128890667 [Hylaeus anthracinus]|uniref:uncharacterized protein LOC128890667 n=1 Tax=Hylaeus anthracinus TaxID=313031 RepID=UPI0023B94599|nr:uncharacterized protein LOC128890667 [Hylaeus anthracinus]